MKPVCWLFVLSFLVLEASAQKKTRKSKPPRPKQIGGVQVVPIPSQNKVDILIDGKLFTSYLFQSDIKKPVLWPVFNSEGVQVTRGFPLKPNPGERNDHPHHIGLWLNHGDVNGHDFWNNSTQIGPEHKGPFGTIVHKTIDNYSSSPSEGTLAVTSYWLDSSGKALLEERTFYKFIKEKKQRFIERETHLKSLVDTVKFKDNKEGFLGFRVARFLEHPSSRPEIFLDAKGNPTSVPIMNNEGVTGKYHSSSGLVGELVWGKRSSWISLHGKKGDFLAGVSIFDHPENFNFPSHWHARGYGLFSINPLGTNVFTEGKELKPLVLPPGDKVIFKHKIMISAGEPLSHEELEKVFQNWANPK